MQVGEIECFTISNLCI